VPAGVDEFKISGAIPDPPRQAAAVFRAALLEAGVEVHGEALTDRMRRESGVALGEFLPGSVELRTQESEPLASIVQHLHETSDNLEAECCYRLLARHAGLSRGVEAIEAHWSGRGLHFEGLRMEDGSGLARANVIRPLDLARLLLWARDGPQGDVFFESLNARYEGRARLKGGAMSRVRTFAGYVETRTRGELVFVLMVNHQDAAEDEVAGWRDRLMAVLVDL
jgi:D-alanyl-D-alanine carboxypeptidase/D-alanyl-D-alanine-endopeptidase (penicillin-binding protein 4)